MKREGVFLIVQDVGICTQEALCHSLLKLLKEVPRPPLWDLVLMDREQTSKVLR